MPAQSLSARAADLANESLRRKDPSVHVEVHQAGKRDVRVTVLRYTDFGDTTVGEFRMPMDARSNSPRHIAKRICAKVPRVLDRSGGGSYRI